eukprot:5531785-Amphidinium_carterae.2
MGEYGRVTITHPAGRGECDEQGTVACSIDVNNVSLPAQSATVKLDQVLPAELYTMLSTASFLDVPISTEEQDAMSLPRMCVRCSDWDALGRKLVEIGLCAVADDEKCPMWGAQRRHLRAGVFGVPKAEGSLLRLIVDRRRKNSTERGLRQGLRQLHSMGLVSDERYYDLLRHMTLPHASQFCDLLLPQGCHFLMSVMDCKDFFYLLKMPKTAMFTTAVGRPVPRSLFRDMVLPPDAVLCDLALDRSCTLFLRAPAMGDLKSVEVAQAAHSAVLKRAGMTDQQWLTFLSPPPCDSCWEGCYVDDYFQGVVIPAPPLDPSGVVRKQVEKWSDRKLADTCKSYDEAEFVVKHSKSRLRVTHTTIWGGELQSEDGWVAGSREKMHRLLFATKRVLECRGRLIPYKLVERLVGHWVHQLTFQRLGMSLLDDIYQLLHKRRLKQRKVLLSKGAHDELLVVLSLWPLFTCDLRRPPGPLIAATDATTRRGGAVIGRLTAEEATWVWARLPRRPGAISWRSLENVLEVVQKASPDEALETFINSHSLEVVLNYVFQSSHHINVQEAVAARSLMKWVTRRGELHGCRFPLLVDSLVVQSVLARGRSCSRVLNKCVRGIAMLALFANIQVVVGWVKSESNPADDPTRLARLRTPLQRPRQLTEEILQVSVTLPYPFQATLAMWHDLGWDPRPATGLFDSTLGYPGEGPRLQWPGQALDSRNSDLRVKVQPATVRRYNARLVAFEQWALTNKVFVSQDVWSATGEQLNAALCAFVQYEYIHGSPYQHGLDLLAGVQMVRPDASLAIRPAWQMQRQWSKLTPVGTRPPMPEQMMLALASAAWTMGLHRVSAVIILMFHCLLQPNKAATCQQSQLLLPSDITPGSSKAAIALPQTKTADHGAQLQSVAIDDASVADLLLRIFGEDPPHQSLIAGGSRGLQLFFERVRLAVGLDNTPWTLATLRGGGALAYLRSSGGNVIWLQFRGRWESSRSMRHYIQAGLAMQAFAKLPSVTKSRIATLAELAPILLNSTHPTLSHPVVE